MKDNSLIKITIDNAQSGGSQISIRDHRGYLLWQERLHLLPKKDGIEILTITSSQVKEEVK